MTAIIFFAVTVFYSQFLSTAIVVVESSVIYFTRTDQFDVKFEGIDLARVNEQGSNISTGKSTYAFELIDTRNFTTTAIAYEDTVLVEFTNDTETRRVGCVGYEFHNDRKGRDEFLQILEQNYSTPYKFTTLKVIIGALNSCEFIKGVLWQNLTIDGKPYFSSLQKIKSASLFNGIVPKTKWCGKGTSALHFNDLGKCPEVDSCCRAHDYCPIKMLAGTTDYANNKTLKYTTSQCDCEIAFFDCLNSYRADHIWARVVGYMYFNIFRPKCITNSSRSLNGSDIDFKMQIVKCPRRWKL